jgi:hypothetical protein
MTSTNAGGQVGGYRREVDSQKLGPALLIASSLVLATRTAKWSPTHSDGLSAVEWDKGVEHSARVAKIVLSHLTALSRERRALVRRSEVTVSYVVRVVTPNGLSLTIRFL